MGSLGRAFEDRMLSQVGSESEIINAVNDRRVDDEGIAVALLLFNHLGALLFEFINRVVLVPFPEDQFLGVVYGRFVTNRKVEQRPRYVSSDGRWRLEAHRFLRIVT